jgi:diguanylate cyclase (GGDEF)-like protein
LVEDNPIDAMRIRQLLARAKSVVFEVDSVANLDHATRRLSRQTPDLILLDLDLPDSVGPDTYATMACAAPTAPIVVLCRGTDEGLGIASVAQGAQDYVMKQSVSAEGLARSIRCAVERQRVVAALRGLTLTDELTGLLNRRGFTTLAQGHLRLAGRTGQRFLLFFADVDGLKAINDQHGHHQGDDALVRAAEVLRRTFRQSDVVARYGGDEFAVLALDTSADRGASILRRLAENIDADNQRHPRGYRFDLSVGTLSLDGAREEALGALLVKADAALYREKRRRSASQVANGGGSGS